MQDERQGAAFLYENAGKAGSNYKPQVNAALEKRLYKLYPLCKRSFVVYRLYEFRRFFLRIYRNFFIVGNEVFFIPA